MANHQRRFAAKITKGALGLLVTEAALSLLYMLSSRDVQQVLFDWLAATSNHIWQQGKVWTLVTGAFFHPDFVSLLFHGLILWMFVPVLERWWGTKRFIRFAIWTSLAGGLAGTLIGLLFFQDALISGLDPFIYATIIAYGVLYSTQKVHFFGVLPMTGKQLAIGMVGFAVVRTVFTQDWPMGASHASAMFLAWILTTGKWTPKLWYLRWKQKRLRRHLKLVQEKPQKWVN